MVFLSCLKILGILLFAFKINVNGPGKSLFISLYNGLEMVEVYLDKLLKPSHRMDKLALLGFLPICLQIFSKTSR